MLNNFLVGLILILRRKNWLQLPTQFTTSMHQFSFSIPHVDMGVTYVTSAQ